MATIAVYSLKGGVGKTTLAVNLAWCAATHSARRTLLWDLDPQAASTYLLGAWEVACLLVLSTAAALIIHHRFEAPVRGKLRRETDRLWPASVARHAKATSPDSH